MNYSCWKRLKHGGLDHERITYKIKALMQLQTFEANSVIQLQLNYYQLKAQGVNQKHKQLLRLSPIFRGRGEAAADSGTLYSSTAEGRYSSSISVSR